MRSRWRDHRDGLGGHLFHGDGVRYRNPGAFEQRTCVAGRTASRTHDPQPCSARSGSLPLGRSRPRIPRKSFKTTYSARRCRPWTNLEPVRSSAGHKSSIASIGTGARCTPTARSTMHGSADRAGFIGTGRTRDPNLSVLFFRNSEGNVIGRDPQFRHPSQLRRERALLQRRPARRNKAAAEVDLGAETGVVYLTGAAGQCVARSSASRAAIPEQPWMGEEGLPGPDLYMTGEHWQDHSPGIHAHRISDGWLRHAAASDPDEAVSQEGRPVLSRLLDR